MIVWVVIEGNPARQYYADARAAEHLDPATARHQLLLPLSPLRSDAEGEDANISIGLDNRSGKASALLARRPPLGARARLMSPTGQLFAGIVTEIRLDAQAASLSIEA